MMHVFAYLRFYFKTQDFFQLKLKLEPRKT